ncbi:MAG: hypothetical protein ACRD0P_09030 [Stackebrandtia sp.]
MTAPAEHTVITKAKDFKTDKSILSDKGDRPGMLIGPHYELAVSGFTASSEVPEDNPGVYGLDAPMIAPEGTEFFLAVMDGKSEVRSNDKVKAELLVDDKKRKLNRLPGPSEAIAAVVPSGSEVSLSVTDEDRTQAINLRDGKRSDEVPGYYNGELKSSDLEDYKGKGKVTADAGSQYEKEKRTLHLDMEVGAAARSPWIEDEGWADDGKVWVTVPVSKMTTDAVWGFKEGSHQPGVDWTLKEKDLFSLNPDPGKATDSKGKTTFKADQSSETDPGDAKTTLFTPSEITLKFQIAEDATKAELKVSPGGKMKAVWSNIDGKCSWDDKPSSGKIKVDF